jgi:hypothetical protein
VSAGALVASRYADAFKPAPLETIKVWAKREVTVDETSPIGGKYNTDNSQYAEEWFHAWQDPRVRMQTTIGPNQGGRTKAMEVASLWSIHNRPGPMQWNGKDNVKAKHFARTRWWPMARKCRPVADKLPKDPRLESPVSFVMTNGLPFTMQGANEGNLQEVSIHTQFNDECFQWEAGMLSTAWKRCDVSYAWNCKIWNGSVADEEGTDIANAYEDEATDQREWGFHCLNPRCKHLQVYRWGGKNKQGGLKWDENNKTRPGGKWNFEELRKSVRYECEQCGHAHTDNLGIRRLMSKGGCYVPVRGEESLGVPRVRQGIKWTTRDGRKFAPFTSSKVSFRYNILAVNWPGLSWSKWVEEFLLAVDQSRIGDYKPLKSFWTRRMAMFWNESKFVNSTRRQVLSDYKLYDNKGVSQYMAQLWEGEQFRFMGVDKQELGYYYVIRSVKADGSSRLIDRGELSSYAEIDHRAEMFRVPPACVLIDSSYETRDVYAAAIQRGWTCTKGEDRADYLHIIQNDNTGQRIKVLRPYSERKQGDPGFKFQSEQTMREIMPGVYNHAPLVNNYARLYLFSNLSIKDLLNTFRQGRSSIYWGIPEDVGNDYLKQMNAEVRYRVPARKGGTVYFWSNAGPDGKQRKKPNHYWDCEVLIMLAIVMQKLINVDNYSTDEATTTEAAVTENEPAPFSEAA